MENQNNQQLAKHSILFMTRGIAPPLLPGKKMRSEESERNGNLRVCALSAGSLSNFERVTRMKVFNEIYVFAGRTRADNRRNFYYLKKHEDSQISNLPACRRHEILNSEPNNMICIS